MDSSHILMLADAVTTVPTVGLTWVTPAFLAALATLVTAITSLVIAFKAQGAVRTTQDTIKDTHAKVAQTAGDVAQVVIQTNGTITALQSRIVQLEAMVAGRRGLPGQTLDSPAPNGP